MSSGTMIKEVRAYVIDDPAEQPDYTKQKSGHWIIDTRVANPMSVYSEYAESRTSWGIGVLGSMIVEVELENGVTGIGQTTAGPPGCWIVENHLKQFAIGQEVSLVGRIWDQMWRASIPYGRKGLVIHAISAVDLAIWDAFGKAAGKPVYELLGGKVRDELPVYATSPAARSVKQQGFRGVKIPLPYGPASGREGLRKNVELLESVRDEVGTGFDVMIDCYMALTVDYAVELMTSLQHVNIRWLEEALIPDDYAGWAELRRRLPDATIATGEHEYTRYGFQQLINCGVDVLQPDMMWCGGLTEAVHITELAAAANRIVIPHGSGPYSYHHQVCFSNTPYAEFLMLSQRGDVAVPLFGKPFSGEPLPQHGVIRLDATPGFGINLDRSAARLVRPFVA